MLIELRFSFFQNECKEPIGAVECEILFDPANEKKLYMGVDITSEINDLFTEMGINQSKFSKGVSYSIL